VSRRGRGNGSSIYLGKPVAVPPGVFIGFPGPTIFFSGPGVVTAQGLTVNFSSVTLDVTNLSVILSVPAS
jgi:hypothetical protein